MNVFRHVHVFTSPGYFVKMASLQSSVSNAYEQPHIIHQHRICLSRTKCNWTERKSVIHMFRWANQHDRKNKAWLQKDTACKQGTLGRVKFFENCFFTENHLEKESVL